MSRFSKSPLYRPKLVRRTWLFDCIVVTAITSIFLTLILRLWAIDLGTPVIYDGDGLLMLDAFKNFHLNNWYFTSDLLGFPYGQSLQDFPAIADGFCLVLSWMLVKVFGNPVVAFNIFYLLTFLISAVGGYFGSRIMGLKRLTSIVIGVLFTFLPFHSLHGAGHTYLVMYPIVPVVVAFVVRIIGELSCQSDGGALEVKEFNRRTCMFIGVAAGVSGLYFAFFSALLFSIGILILKISGQSFKRLTPFLFSLAGTIISVLGQSVPILIFQKINGPNTSVASRTTAEVEYYSLRILDLLRPIPNHLIDWFSTYSQRTTSSLIPGEPTAHLGLIGAVGVFVLIFALLVPAQNLLSKIRPLAQIFLLLLIFSVLGGFNQLLASFGFTQIRVWSRSSIFIGFISLAAVGIILEKVFKEIRVTSLKMFSLCVLILVVGVADTNRIVPDDTYAVLSKRWNNDSELVDQIEHRFGQGGRVLQLPILKFPEQGTINQLSDYAQVRGYLHSDTLCWSYGAVIGRDNGRTVSWQQLDLASLVNAAQLQGFDALWLERRAYADNGIETNNQLEKLLGPAIFEDQQQEVLVFDLRDSAQNQRVNCKDK